MAKFDVVVAENYTHKGEERTKWTNIGRIIETEKGFSLKLDVIPIGWDGWAKLFEPKPKEAQTTAQPQTVAAGPVTNEFNDDIPF